MYSIMQSQNLVLETEVRFLVLNIPHITVKLVHGWHTVSGETTEVRQGED